MNLSFEWIVILPVMIYWLMIIYVDSRLYRTHSNKHRVISATCGAVIMMLPPFFTMVVFKSRHLTEVDLAYFSINVAGYLMLLVNIFLVNKHREEPV